MGNTSITSGSINPILSEAVIGRKTEEMEPVAKPIEAITASAVEDRSAPAVRDHKDIKPTGSDSTLTLGNLSLNTPTDTKQGGWLDNLFGSPSTPNVNSELLAQVYQKRDAALKGEVDTSPITGNKTAPRPNDNWKAGGLYSPWGKTGRDFDTARAIPGYKMDALEAEFGKFKGIGRNTNPRNAAGPIGGTHLCEAYDKLCAGDIEGAKASYKAASKTASPVMLDLNGDGKLGTTGVSTAKERATGEIGKTVSFDIDGDGTKDNIEWMSGDGDGMLVDDSDGGATRALNTDGEIDGTRLFGDQGGKFANGYEKLKRFDKDGDGKLTGAELDGLKVWVDDGDARLGQGELKSLRELGITEISVVMKLEQNTRGEDLMRSSFTQNGQSKITEDVWFADASKG
ncbi:hypothetical protein J7643_16395 [bacterium]|nr:hypothetical protein [bacterium]